MGTFPLTPGGLIWAGIISPTLDPVVESMLPDRFRASYDVSQFVATLGSDYLFADLLAKFMFHEQYALTFSQEVRMRIWARTWTRAVSVAPAVAMVGAVTILGVAAAMEMHSDSSEFEKIASLGGLPITFAGLGGF